MLLYILRAPKNQNIQFWYKILGDFYSFIAFCLRRGNNAVKFEIGMQTTPFNKILTHGREKFGIALYLSISTTLKI